MLLVRAILRVGEQKLLLSDCMCTW